jgi:hypothetical protein
MRAKRRVPERLEVEQDNRGPGIALPVLEQVVARHVGLVADADERRQAELPLAGELQDRQTERPLLDEKAIRPAGGTIGENDAFRRTPAAVLSSPCSWARSSACPWPRTVSTSSLLPGAPGVADFREARGDDDQRLDTAAAHCSTTPTTGRAGTAMTARSTPCGASTIEGNTCSP